MKSLNNDLAENIPTWSAYNSILADKKPTNTHCILPIIQGTPTDWSNLYLIIAASAKLNVNIGQSSKTIISLDLQLYMKCIQLQSFGNINQNFIFCMGELYTVFCMMKVLGKIIDAIGLDMSLSIADIYGTTTVEQIKSGKHVYRSFEGYLTLYLSLYKIYLQKFVDTNPLIEGDIRSGIINSIENLKNYKHHKTANCKMNPKETINFLENINFHGLQDKSDKFLTNQAKYFCNFMKVFELLLLFTRPTRQQLCELHLSTSHELVKYLFADDMCNYARMTPAYLSQMYQYEMKDSETWEFFMNGYFSVNKTSVLFTVFGTDQLLSTKVEQ